MWCHHLMMIVNQMWPTRGNTSILTNLTSILTKWRSLGKKAALTPKKVKFWAKKKSNSPHPSGHGLFAKKTGPKWSNLAYTAPLLIYRGL